MVSRAHNKDLYGGVPEVFGRRPSIDSERTLDVEGEYQNFIRKMKSGGQSRRIAWFSVAATVVILISPVGGYWKIHCCRKKQEVMPWAEHIVPGRNQAVLITESERIRVECIPR